MAKLPSFQPITRAFLALLGILLVIYTLWGLGPFKITHSVGKPDTKQASSAGGAGGAVIDPLVERSLRLNNAEAVANLYLDSFKEGSIPFGTTGNVFSSKDSTLENEEDTQNDRSKPMSHLNIPDEKSFSDITPGEFLKGDATFQSFFKYIFDLINKNHLSYPLKRRMELQNGKPIIDNVLFYKDTIEKLTESELHSFFEFPSNFLSDLKIKHKNVIDGLPDVVPNFYSGNGYIIVGGGIYSWYALLGIETLRKVGATYPIEVILPDINDYEFDYCEIILPKLNAKCVEMYRVFGKTTLQHFDVKGYQFKAFALLASSFENAFLLDSDAYAVKNPDKLFDSELYENYKMITWPDFWRRTGSPQFYDIQGKEIGQTPIRHLNDFFINPKFIDYDKSEDVYYSVTYHDRKGTIPDWTTESGEMIINKRVHFKTLLLALYYNFDGPYGYYPLLSQGGAGEGDKETFVAAANYFDLPWYQVNKRPESAFGWWSDSGIYEHSSIVQYDPLLDYEILQELKTTLRQDMEINSNNNGDGDSEESENFKYDYNNYFPKFFKADKGQPMIYHVHDPKMDPFSIIDRSLTTDSQGNKIRNMGEDFPRNEFDLEFFLWKKIDQYICKEQVNFNAFERSDWQALCVKFIDDHLEFLKGSGKRIWDAYQPELAVEQMKGGNHN